ncbi:hypothetical protein [Arthrobacter sp. H16F315]|uniref:hypothetical protein n=1 Tax=Arthrobacter sp. H16F315 TaxID=2955314 RepID=UPI002097FEC3|nr:hypothetical protein [Arthrobacter sp. H16F315]MDD1477949.1 hypothetical protein [Arthrobacter sp. H16F315]
MEELEPTEVIALEVARTDMHYVAATLLHAPPELAAAEIALVQYGAMAAYESQLYFARTLGWNLKAEWAPDAAKAARMSGKFFADNKRNLDGVVSHFDELLKANHGAFFPPDRAKQFDALRDDLSVITVDGRPYTSLISAHYLTGLGPTQIASFQEVGPAVGRLSVGIGNIAGALLQNSGIAMHSQSPMPSVEFWDATSTDALPRLFGGELSPSLAAALLTVQSIAATAERGTARAVCQRCEAGAQKHRFVALFQSLTAVTILRDATPEVFSEDMLALLADPESEWLLAQSKLRNGLIHLGMQDIASKIGPGETIDDAVAAYTGLEAHEVATRVSQHLSRFVTILTSWMLTPRVGGKSFMAALHRPPAD